MVKMSSVSPKKQAAVMTSNPLMTSNRNDPANLPLDYSTTPGGTLYSTTPGGTRIVYDRSFLMHLKNSPISHTPPKNLASIPISIHKETPMNGTTNKRASPPNKVSPDSEEMEQFQMDM